MGVPVHVIRFEDMRGTVLLFPTKLGKVLVVSCIVGPRDQIV